MATTARTLLVTGTSSGIGLAAAVGAARAGWTVIATMRDVGKADRLREAASAAGVEVDIRPLDVTHPTQATDVIAAVVAEYGALHAVINNAGAGKLGTTELLELDEFRAAMELNFFGVVRVTQAALPHLRATGGRVLTVTSVGGVVGQPFNDAYCAAKFAAEGMLESLHPVAKAVGVAVAVIEPAAVASDFVDNVGIDRDALLASAGAYRPRSRAISPAPRARSPLRSLSPTRQP
ncbi:hypothetical protein BH11ACT3_BH11ACT3_16250 [soil metagenome]